jgi:hypothetical protein
VPLVGAHGGSKVKALRINGMKGARIELFKGPDDLGRYSYTLYWMQMYYPRWPDNMKPAWRKRAQCFFADPTQHRLPKHRIKDLRLRD